MIVEAFYQNVLPSHLIGPIQEQAKEFRRYERIKQNYLGDPYRTVDVQRVPTGHPIEEHIVKTMVYFNNEFFQYDLSGTFEVQMMRYRPGDGFKWHSDYGLSEHPELDRKLSFSLQLSHPWEYNGAEIDIMDWYHQDHVVSKECGAFVVFDSRVPHRVRGLKDGERNAIVAWAHGPKLR